MPNSAIYIAAVIAAAALTTMLTRAVPYIVFGRLKQLPKTLQYLSTVLPASIMVILVVYCLRSINVTAFPFGLPEVISVAVVVVTQLLRKNAFISVVAGTACYMLLIRTVFAV